MTGSARMGRPPVLTREAIARAVIDVGFTNLTVAAVRDRLGVGHTTLYRYTADRDELVRIGLGHLLQHADWPSRDGTWRDVLTRHALTLWQLWEAHPGSATEAARGVLPLTGMRLIEDLCAILLRQGFTPATAILACDIVFDMVTDNRRDIEDRHSTGSGAGLEQREAAAHPHWAPSSTDPGATEDERQAIRLAVAEARAADPLEWFTSKLRVALDGVEHTLAPPPV
ncbi:MAG: TetR/AcrR family transcriptional regulator [Arachnia sp.]